MIIVILLGAGCATAACVVVMLVRARSDLVSEEIRGWLEIVPGAILRMAAMQLDLGQRLAIYREEWLPTSCFIARKAEGRPITRLLMGTKYSLGMLRSARREARDLRHAQRRELAVADPAAATEFWTVVDTHGSHPYLERTDGKRIVISRHQFCEDDLRRPGFDPGSARRATPRRFTGRRTK